MLHGKKILTFFLLLIITLVFAGCDFGGNDSTSLKTSNVSSETNITTTNNQETSEETTTLINSTDITSVINTTGQSTSATTYQTYTVRFDAMGGSSVESQSVISGNTVVVPETTYEGHTLDGWYLSSDGGTTFDEEWLFATDTVNRDITLYAKWIALEDLLYQVTFENTGDSYLEPITQMINTTINEPEEPVKNGHIFAGWYQDSSFNLEFNFSTVINEDVTLYAKWIEDPDMIEITFETYGGSEMETIYTEPNEAVIIPKTSLKDGHIFLGWYKDQEFTKQAYSPLTVTEDTVLYAKWYEEPNVVYIFFDSNGGSPIDPYQKRPGQMISSPSPPPTKPGYDFIGWYENQEFTRRYYFTSMGSETITLYAKWQKIELQDDAVLDSVESTLSGWDFTCLDHVCTYELSSGYNYVFDFNTNEFSYIKHTVEENETGYRNYDSVITIDSDWVVTYSFIVEEDFGYEFHTTFRMTGNYQTEVYEVIEFDSNIQSLDARKEAALSSIGYFADFVTSMLEASNLSMDDLN